MKSKPKKASKQANSHVWMARDANLIFKSALTTVQDNMHTQLGKDLIKCKMTVKNDAKAANTHS